MLEVGDKGRPVDGELKVIQVVSDKSFLAGMYYYDHNVPKVHTVLITEYDTEKLLDNRLLQCTSMFEVIGTAKYDTATGTNKVPLLKLVKDK